MTCTHRHIDVCPQIWDAITNPARITCLYGGSASGKTYTCLQYILSRLLDSEPFTAAVVRRYMTTITTTIWPQMLALIDDWGLQSAVKINKTSHEISIGRNICRFVPAADENRVTGADFDFWLLDEAYEIPEGFFDQVRNRSGRSKERSRAGKIVLAWNPVSDQSWLYRRFILQSEPSSHIFWSTYKINTHLREDYIRNTLLAYRDTNPRYYDIYTLGNWGTAEGLIYPDNWMYLGDMQNPPQWSGYDCIGVDWGSSPGHPTAIVGLRRVNAPAASSRAAEECTRYTIVCDELLYRADLAIADLAEWIAGTGRQYGISGGNIPVYCDTARPDLMAEIRMRGAHVPQHVSKDVELGITFVKGCQLLLTPRSSNLAHELRNYVWDRDRVTGAWLPHPVKSHDHLMDALRYAAYTHWGKTRRQAAEPAASEGYTINWDDYSV